MFKDNLISQLETIIKEGNIQKIEMMIKSMKENGWLSDICIKKLEENMKIFNLIEIENLFKKIIQHNKVA